jgi:hypothetical protein
MTMQNTPDPSIPAEEFTSEIRGVSRVAPFLRRGVKCIAGGRRAFGHIPANFRHSCSPRMVGLAGRLTGELSSYHSSADTLPSVAASMGTNRAP